MAQIDVSELMDDPDFVDELTVLNRTSWVDNNGMNRTGEMDFKTVGSVQPASARTVQKLPEAMRVADMSSFWIKGTIVATAPGKYSSIIVFRKKRYQIISVADWSNFGAGYSEGICVAEVPS